MTAMEKSRIVWMAYARGEYIDKGGEVGHCYATYGVFEGERC